MPRGLALSRTSYPPIPLQFDRLADPLRSLVHFMRRVLAAGVAGARMRQSRAPPQASHADYDISCMGKAHSNTLRKTGKASMPLSRVASAQLVELDAAGIRSPKARGLAWLRRKTGRVPETYVWLGGGAPTPSDMSALDQDAEWAVRSSSLGEDGLDRANAGRFTTVLKVKGAEALTRAAETVLKSAAVEAAPRHMDLIFQRMITPLLAGVAFSRNPVTGLNEVVVEAVEGLADDMVSGTRAPLRWIWRGTGFTLSPSRWDEVVAKIAAESRQLATKFGRPVDLEWAYDGSLWWLQVRPITALGDARVYSNRISREVMPGLIKPMVWSINMPLVNAAWIRLIEEAVGKTNLAPRDLARQFAYRSYFNMTAMGRIFELMGFPHDSLEILLGLPNTPRPSVTLSRRTLALLPRLLRFSARLFRYQRELNALPDLKSSFATLAARSLPGMTDDDLLKHIDGLRELVGRMAEFNIVTPLLANLYAAARRRVLKSNGIDDADVELADDASRLTELDPNPRLRKLGALLQNGDTRAAQELASFIEVFGHLSDSGNDISVAPWRETPDRVAEMARRTAAAQVVRKSRMSVHAARARMRRGRRIFDFVHGRAKAFQLAREDVSFAYTLGYGLLRPACLEVGRRLAERGVLGEGEQVMFLALDEAQRLMREPCPMQEIVASRCSDYAAAQDVVMPEIIHDDNFKPLTASAASSTRRVSGTGTSRGQHTAPLRVVRSSEDFAKVEQGDIVAVPYSDVGWAPIFAVAGGIVAESGGMLSHSSIVARELGIPCIVSAAGALQLPEGARVVIDGLAGEVVVLEEQV